MCNSRVINPESMVPGYTDKTVNPASRIVNSTNRAVNPLGPSLMGGKVQRPNDVPDHELSPNQRRARHQGTTSLLGG